MISLLELKTAYEILGLPEGASRDELEKRFEYLIKRGKAAAISKELNSDIPILNMDAISEAYNRIISNQLALSEKEEEKRNPHKPNPIFKLLKVDEKKARNYIHYHKFNYIFGVIGLIILIYLVKTIVFHVNPDVNLAFLGQIYYSETSVLEKKIETTYPEIKAVGVDGASFSSNSTNANSEQDSAMLQKAMVLFAAGGIDIYVLDKENFKKYADLGAFSSLDQLVVQLGIDKSKYKDFSLTPKEEKSAHFYGIDVSSSSILKLSKVSGKNMVAAIKINSKKWDNAVKVLKVLLK